MIVYIPENESPSNLLAWWTDTESDRLCDFCITAGDGTAQCFELSKDEAQSLYEVLAEKLGEKALNDESDEEHSDEGQEGNSEVQRVQEAVSREEQARTQVLQGDSRDGVCHRLGA